MAFHDPGPTVGFGTQKTADLMRDLNCRRVDPSALIVNYEQGQAINRQTLEVQAISAAIRCAAEGRPPSKYQTPAAAGAGAEQPRQ